MTNSELFDMRKEVILSTLTHVELQQEQQRIQQMISMVLTYQSVVQDLLRSCPIPPAPAPISTIPMVSILDGDDNNGQE